MAMFWVFFWIAVLGFGAFIAHWLMEKSTSGVAFEEVFLSSIKVIVSAVSYLLLSIVGGILGIFYTILGVLLFPVRWLRLSKHR